MIIYSSLNYFQKKLQSFQQSKIKSSGSLQN
ncbi:hypothetical protein CIPAW_15G084900 [Carya illinoinensis]|uniref:Uncharacterized protein n=1 Tax=Carya illinoinensis TaxID=32201 RepID=A0A8T1NCU4_CARIL|nr:hypothetical protein CIPAW_15G084900 [Carya illinoinensis]